MTTEDLIQHLAATARPVERLQPPLRRALAYLLRHARRLRPRATAAIGALGAAALSATAVSTFHGVDAVMMVLITHLGTAAMVSLVAYACGRPLFGVASAARAA